MGRDTLGHTPLDSITGQMSTRGTPNGMLTRFVDVAARAGVLNAVGSAVVANGEVGVLVTVDLVDGVVNVVGVPLCITGPLNRVKVSVPPYALVGAGGRCRWQCGAVRRGYCGGRATRRSAGSTVPRQLVPGGKSTRHWAAKPVKKQRTSQNHALYSFIAYNYVYGELTACIAPLVCPPAKQFIATFYAHSKLPF